MRILTLNLGSSSLKAHVVEMPSGVEFFAASISLTGEPLAGLEAVAQAMEGIDMASVDAIGHRVVHGGSEFTDPVRLDEATFQRLDEVSSLAPLHNPPALQLARAARQRWPERLQVAVFDTAFHATLPPAAFTYAVPPAWRAKGVRRFGFHGLSHAGVAHAAAHALGRDASTLRIVSCHLGHGASVCAIAGGRSVETSMGFTPLEGLVMGSRAGDLDAGVLLFARRSMGIDDDVLEQVLQHESGLRALSRHGADVRALESAADSGDAEATLAMDIYVHRLRKYIGAYAAVLGGIDVLAFTGGVGENAPGVRDRACRDFEFLGVRLDESANKRRSPQPVNPIHAAGSPAAIFVIAAREHLAIAREVASFMEKG